MNFSGKEKQMTVRSGGRTIRTQGNRSSWKKAIVTLQEGFTIDIYLSDSDEDDLSDFAENYSDYTVYFPGHVSNNFFPESGTVSGGKFNETFKICAKK